MYFFAFLYLHTFSKLMGIIWIRIVAPKSVPQDFLLLNDCP